MRPLTRYLSMTFKASMTAGLSLIVISGTTLLGTTLPETYPLPDAEMAPNPVDPNLNAWLLQHAEQPSPFDLDAAAFDEFVARQDAVTRVYLQLARGNRNGGASKELVDAVTKQIAGAEDDDEDSEGRAQFYGHSLVPNVYYELLRTEHLSPEMRSRALAGIAEGGQTSCAQKQLVYDNLNRDALASLKDEGLRDLLMRIERYRSETYRKNALRKFAGSLPKERQSAVTERLLAMLRPYPAIIRDSAWLKAAAEAKGKTSHETQASFDAIAKQSGQRQCSAAKTLLLETLEKIKDKSTLVAAVSAGKAIDGCYRRRDPKLRRDFWKTATMAYEKTYGFAGWAEAKLRLGYIHWTADEFDDAKPLFQEVITHVGDQKGDKEAFAGRAVYALARIAENQLDYERAISFYRDYTTKYVGHENYDDAVMALVLLHVDKRAWDDALKPLVAHIEAQGNLPIDQRSVSSLSFALFWAGRIHLEQGRPKEAAEMWRRVASEYYSTYYGAIGHYMLEQSSERKLALQPSRTPSFRMHALREAFNPADQVRVKRAEILMRLGLADESICELEELDTDDGKPEKVLVKALMLHASGRWLDAVRSYDSLPRSFRNSLPVGFERILFPRRYTETIQTLAKSLDVDPDFVFSIIRQESVFNPMARSPAGALGLMQLMPQTAKVEAKRLRKEYLPQAERNQLKQLANSTYNLLVPDTNLKIGIHHVRTLIDLYQSPVYVLTAYNASPTATKRWMNTIPTGDVLSFIEKIPYKETRAYVKLVLRNYFYFKRWYGSPGEKLPHLDTVTSPLVAMLNKPEQAAIAPATDAADIVPVSSGAVGPAAAPATIPNH